MFRSQGAPAIDENFTSSKYRALRSSSPKGLASGGISYGSAAIIRGQRTVKPIALAADENSPANPGLLADGSVNQQAFKENFYPYSDLEVKLK